MEGCSFDVPEPLPSGACLPGRSLDQTKHLAATETWSPGLQFPINHGAASPHCCQRRFPSTASGQLAQRRQKAPEAKLLFVALARNRSRRFSSFQKVCF